MSLKQTILTELFRKKETYGATGLAGAEAAFKADHPELAASWNPGYFKFFWNKIFLENVLENPEHDITKSLAKYTARLERPAAPAAPALAAEPGQQAGDSVVIRTFTTNGVELDPDMFKQWMTGTVFDDIHSDDGGAMAACSIV